MEKNLEGNPMNAEFAHFNSHMLYIPPMQQGGGEYKSLLYHDAKNKHQYHFNTRNIK